MNAPETILSRQSGIHADIPMALYVADKLLDVPTLSSSCAGRLITLSPLHAWHRHPRLNPYTTADDSDASDKGSVAHDLLLGGEGTIAVIDPKDYPGKKGGIPAGWTNDAIKAARDDARAKGLTPILADRMQEGREMAAAARAFVAASEIAGAFDAGQCELTMIWQEGETWCRARPDWLTNDRSLLVHYKTTLASAEPESFNRRMLISMGYDLAAAFYERGLRALCPSARTTSVFLVQEQLPPYACSLIGLSPMMQEMAALKVSRALELWKRCMRLGKWPGYPTRICWAEPPAWAQRAMEDQPISEGSTGYDPELAMQG